MNVSTEVAEGESTHVAGTGRGTQPGQVEPGTGLVPNSSNNSISAVNGVALNSGLTGASVGTLNPGAACAQAEPTPAIEMIAIVFPKSSALHASFKWVVIALSPLFNSERFHSNQLRSKNEVTGVKCELTQEVNLEINCGIGQPARTDISVNYGVKAATAVGEVMVPNLPGPRSS